MLDGAPVNERTSHLNPWRRSGEFRKIARQSALNNLEAFKHAPHCGAARKRDGAPCCNPAMANGRCALHGGLTPRGDQWHRPQWSARPEKLNRKLRDRERAEKRRAARVAEMTPQERAAYIAWQNTHQPGPRGKRESARVRRQQDREAAKLLASRRLPAGDQAAIDALTSAIEALRREAARIALGIDLSEATEGVFG
jgi:hypothetical protein